MYNGDMDEENNEQENDKPFSFMKHLLEARKAIFEDLKKKGKLPPGATLEDIKVEPKGVPAGMRGEEMRPELPDDDEEERGEIEVPEEYTKSVPTMKVTVLLDQNGQPIGFKQERYVEPEKERKLRMPHLYKGAKLHTLYEAEEIDAALDAKDIVDGMSKEWLKRN